MHLKTLPIFSSSLLCVSVDRLRWEPDPTAIVDHMAFVIRQGSAERKQCTKHLETRNCYKCFACDRWFCDECDNVHPCYGCGGTYCFECRPCPFCETMRAENNEIPNHPNSVRCDCGCFVNLASGGCEECYRVTCLANPSECDHGILTNRCCGRDICWNCSWVRYIRTTDTNINHRICRTAPLPSNAVLRPRATQGASRSRSPRR